MQQAEPHSLHMYQVFALWTQKWGPTGTAIAKCCFTRHNWWAFSLWLEGRQGSQKLATERPLETYYLSIQTFALSSGTWLEIQWQKKFMSRIWPPTKSAKQLLFYGASTAMELMSLVAHPTTFSYSAHSIAWHHNNAFKKLTLWNCPVKTITRCLLIICLLFIWRLFLFSLTLSWTSAQSNTTSAHKTYLLKTKRNQYDWLSPAWLVADPNSGSRSYRLVCNSTRVRRLICDYHLKLCG